MFVLLLLILQRSIELQRPLPLYRICVLKQLSVERQSCQILGEKTLSSGVLESFLLDAPFSGAVIFPARFSTFFCWESGPVFQDLPPYLLTLLGSSPVMPKSKSLIGCTIS